MNRRTFFKNCSFMVAGAAAAKAMTVLPKSLIAAPHTNEYFSLNVLTNQPDKAVTKIEALIKQTAFPQKNISFTQYGLAGNHVSDLVFIRNNKLVDFRHANDKLSEELHEVARSLELPNKVKDPVLVKFYSRAATAQPQNIQVFHRNTLIEQLAIDADREAHTVKGSKGNVKLTIHNKVAQLVDASCRHKTCMKMGTINQAGQSIVCIPNELRIAVAGKRNLGVDDISY